MSTETFDPTAPLPGPPDPWASTDRPSRRPGPPYHMTDMIAAEPALAGRILGRSGPGGSATGATAALAAAVAETLRAGRPVVATGCGTSEHASLGVADILADAARSAGIAGPRPSSAQAFELALDPPSEGLVIGISHEGGTAATNAALRASRAAGARTALITVSDRAPGALEADIVVETDELDQGWCHTVGYLSPLVAAAAVGSHLSGRAIPPAEASRVLAAGASDTDGAEGIAAELAGAARIIVIASGVDRTAGRELVLKIEEGSWIPTAYRDLETFLHGHLPATGPDTGLVLVLADRAAREPRLERATGALRAARVLGIRSAAILAADLDGLLDADLTPAGRLLAAESSALPGPVAALLATATPLQLLTERLARARGTDPDPIRRDDPRYAAAADAIEG